MKHDDWWWINLRTIVINLHEDPLWNYWELKPSVRFEILKITVKITAFWNVSSCTLVDMDSYFKWTVGQDSLVGIANHYKMDGLGLVGGVYFLHMSNRRWGPPSLLNKEYQFSLPGVKRPGVALTTHPYLGTQPKMEYLNSPSAPSWPRTRQLCTLISM